MSATPTIRSSQPPAGVWDLAALGEAVERLLEAPDSASVMESCELMLTHLAFPCRLYWHRMGEPPGYPGKQFSLAEDPQGSRTLTLEWADLPPSESVREHLHWLGRLADTRLRQLAETSRLYEAISRLAQAERL
jgi:hypothetical protein